jgi:hypothetical protein
MAGTLLKTIRSRISDHKLYGTVGFGSPSLYIGLTVASHLVNLDRDWVQLTLSELALARDGWLEILSVIIIGCCVIAIGLGLYRRIGRRWRMKVGPALLGVTGLSFITLAVFKTSSSDVITAAILIHRAAVVAIAAGFPLACLTMARGLRSYPLWRNLAGYTLAAGIIGIALDIAGAVAIGGFRLDVAGLWERAAIANGIVWCQVMGTRLLMMAIRRIRARVLDQMA